MNRGIGTALLSLAASSAIVGGALLGVVNTPDEPEPSSNEKVPLSKTPPYVGDTTRVERVADGLRESDVFVDPLAAGTLTPQERAGIAERASASPVPVRIAVVPMTTEDESGGDSEIFAHALHHVLKDDAVYIVAEPSTMSTSMNAVAFGVPVDSMDLLDAGEAGRAEGASLADALDGALDTVDAAADEGAEPEADPTPYVNSEAPPTPRERVARFFGEGFLPGLLLLGPLAGLLLFGIGVAARTGARTFLDTHAVLRAAGADLHEAARPRRAPSRPSRRRLRRRARTEVAALRTGIEAAGPEHPGMADAMSALDGALLILGEEHDDLDLVGVIVLARHARQRIDGERGRTPPPVCMANPLHGAATERRTLPGMHIERFPVCAPCAARTLEARERVVLRVVDHGRRVRHYTLDRFWVQTRYGAVGPGLPATVLEALNAH